MKQRVNDETKYHRKKKALQSRMARLDTMDAAVLQRRSTPHGTTDDKFQVPVIITPFLRVVPSVSCCRMGHFLPEKRQTKGV